MKKILSLLTLALFTLLASAQTGTTPNRLLVNSQLGTKAFAIDKVDSLSFARVDGEIKANVQFLKFATGEADTLWVSVQRTEAAKTFSIEVLPTNTAKAYSTDDIIARYMEMSKSAQYGEDFTSGQMTGFPKPFAANTSYTIVTMAYDQYGVPGQASRAEFTTPKTPTVGNPTVTYTIDSIGAQAVKMTATPNADCSEFYWCQFKKGEAQTQFEQWGPMMGFNNIEEMVKSFSWYGYSDTQEKVWDGLAPNTEYEIYVVPTDINGTFGDMVIIPFTTAKLGGNGTATVDITIGDFGGDETSGYYQNITFTPNDQTAVYHALIMQESYYNANYTDETIKNVLTSETNPFNPWDNYWSLYDANSAAWSADKGTAYLALALAQNANGEWGPLAKKAYSTPADADAAAAPVVPFAPKRFGNDNAQKRPGMVPQIQQKSVKMVEMK